MVGAAIVRHLSALGHSADDLLVRTHAEMDLTCQGAVREFFESQRPDEVYLAAAKVGGIHANSTYPAEFIYENLMMEANVIHEAFRVGVRKLLCLGSSCIYPRMAAQPIREDALLTGALEPTNEPYAVAKIAAIKLCESYNKQYGAKFGVDYRSVMPTNLYGPGDNYHIENSHVVPALIRRFYDAHRLGSPSVTIWGTGTPRREFLFVDDMARACVQVMNLERQVYAEYTQPSLSHLNVGYGHDVSIRELVDLIRGVVGYEGGVEFDTTKPDGAPRKLLDSGKLRSLGWQPTVSLQEGLRITFDDFLRSKPV
jgi:GDP-L-fucose synthase